MIEGKIIGYRTPMPLFGGKVPKGTIYKYIFDSYLATVNIGGIMHWLSTCFNLPKEIVETWEPVYKEEEEFKIGDWVTVGKSPKEGMNGYAGCPTGTFEVIEDNIPTTGLLTATEDSFVILTNITGQLGWRVKPGGIRKATEEEIIKAKPKYLNTRDTPYGIIVYPMEKLVKIGEETIYIETIEKILKMLKV